MRSHRNIIAALALMVVAVVATPALAQDYTLSDVNNKFTEPPTTAVDLSLGDDQIIQEDLPFEFAYYGTVANEITVSSNGYIQISPSGTPNNSSLTNQGWPPAQTNVNYDGLVAGCWDDLNPSNNNGQVLTFTTGLKPNRIFHVSWKNVPRFSNSGSTNWQIQLHETTNRIIIAYSATNTWTNIGCSIGIVAPNGANDSRFVTPNNSTNISAVPPNDYQFDPVLTKFEGQLFIDELVTDATGIAGGTNAGVPLGGMRVELFGAGAVSAFASTAADGSFEINGVALAGAINGELRVAAQTNAARVTDDVGNAVFGSTFASNVSFGANKDVGTFTFDDTSDASGAKRLPLQMARGINEIHQYVTGISADPIPQIDVVYDTASALPTAYILATEDDPAFVRLASPGATNPDGADPAVIARIYARHVLLHSASQVGGTFQNDITATSDADAAFSDGFGAFLHALVTGETSVFDGTSDTTANELNLETPGLLTTPNEDTAAWVAAALFDLLDASGTEAHDVIDGTLPASDDHVFQVIDALTVAPRASGFVDEWDTQGRDSIGLVRNFIRHGLLGDDDGEPNDTDAEAQDLGLVGQRLTGLTLNRFNEDWYEVFVPTLTDAVFVEMTYNRGSIDADVTLRVLSTAGAVLATGTPSGDTGPIQAITGTVGPARIRIQIRHNSGDRVDPYDLQVYSRLRADGDPLPEWTVNRGLTQNFTIDGGIAPFQMVVRAPSVLPPGLTLDAVNRRLIGAPIDIGPAAFTISVEDSAIPVNIANISQTILVNRPFTLNPPEFTGVALGKVTDIGLGRSGGTSPVTVTNIDGTIPAGLQLITPDFRLTGTPTAPGGSQLTIEATDLAQSSDSGATTVVVCVPIPAKKTVVDVAAGDAQAGFFFDAVAGSVATLKVKTGKKQPKRLLGALVLGPDGAPVVGGKIKSGKGKATLSKIPLTASGRYFVALSAAAGDATQLVGTLKVAPQKKGKAKILDLGAGDTVILDVGVLAGAQFTLKTKASKEFGVRLQFIFKPDGTLVPVGDLTVTEKGAALTISGTFDQSGTYQVRLTPQPGVRGDLSYSFKLKQPKGVIYSVD